MSEPFDFEGETDMELLGGTFEDDPKPEEPEIKQDEPAPKEEPKAEDEPKEAPTPDDDEPEEPQPKRDTVIPRARFDEVNAKLHAEREEAARLRAELEALTKKPEPADTNIDTLEDEYFEAMIAGDKTKAKEIRATINTEIFNRAQAASAETAAATLTQREMQTSFSKAVEQTVSAYPFLDSTKPEANAEAIAEVVEWRCPAEVTALQARADAALLDTLVPQATVVLDCSDNFPTRQAVNAACVAQRRPLVSGAAIGLDGQIAVWDARTGELPCYACLFPPTAEVPEVRCATMGVFAPLVGIIGTMQAAEALKLLAGFGQPLAGRLQMLDCRRMEWTEIQVGRDAACPVCSARA